MEKTSLETLPFCLKDKRYPVRVFWAFQVTLVVQTPPASARDVRDAVLIPGSEDPLEEVLAAHASIPA